MIKILVACEESQEVTKAFRKRGFQAYSCDIIPCSGGHPEWHYEEDVLQVLAREHWDVLIAFPPCTDLCVSGARHFERKRKDGSQQRSIDFFMKIANCGVEHISIENPVGIMSSVWRKPNQIVQPYEFGHKEKKSTCLWLKNLPLLVPTGIVEPEYVLYASKKNKSGFSKYNPRMGTISSKNNPEAAKLRSKTFTGIAEAMAEQWGEYLSLCYD